MTFDLFKKYQPVFSPADGGGAGAGTAGEGGDGGAGDGGAGDAGTGDGGAKWFEGDTFTDEHRTLLTAKGLATNDPMEMLPKILDMQLAADRRLGADPSQLITKPKERTSGADWVREHGSFIGVPDAADKYNIEKPADWPENADWDEDLVAELKTAAHEEGMSTAAANRVAGIYAKKVAGMLADAETQLAQANDKMMGELTKEWGKETPAKMAAAQQAASVLMEKAGIDAAALQGFANLFSQKAGDAGTVRLFAAVADMMGDDTLQGAGRGATGFGTTPAEARQKLAQMRAPDGEYGKAVASGDRAAMEQLQPEIERLSKIAAS